MFLYFFFWSSETESECNDCSSGRGLKLHLLVTMTMVQIKFWCRQLTLHSRRCSPGLHHFDVEARILTSFSFFKDVIDFVWPGGGEVERV